jgi:hypothetical protein
MNQPRRHTALPSLATLASVLLWGAIEVVALARSRWSTRPRHGRGLPSGGQRG